MSVRLKLYKRYLAVSLIGIIFVVPFYVYLHFFPTYDDTKLPPVIVQPLGGLGNQMFQFVAAYSLAKTRNAKLYLCLPNNWESSMNSKQLLESHVTTDRSYLLWAFNIFYDNILIANEFGCTRMTNFSDTKNTEMYFVNESTILNNGNIPIDKAIYLAGYFESEIFFQSHQSEIIRQFTLKPEIERQLESSVQHFASTISYVTESVAVHVRRRDFISENRLIPISYYENAIKRMKIDIARAGGDTKKITFFVFSDDIDVVKSDFQNIAESFVFVSNKQLSQLADFMLMTMCKHIIVANSTFSWWTAYLNRNKKRIIIAPLPRNPQEWTESQHFDEFYTRIYGGNLSYPQKWITINPFRNS